MLDYNERYNISVEPSPTYLYETIANKTILKNEIIKYQNGFVIKSEIVKIDKDFFDNVNGGYPYPQVKIVEFRVIMKNLDTE
jgi:hypothetical protein